MSEQYSSEFEDESVPAENNKDMEEPVQEDILEATASSMGEIVEELENEEEEVNQLNETIEIEPQSNRNVHLICYLCGKSFYIGSTFQDHLISCKKMRENNFRKPSSSPARFSTESINSWDGTSPPTMAIPTSEDSTKCINQYNQLASKFYVPLNIFVDCLL